MDCNECPRPSGLVAENEPAVNAWRLVSKTGRNGINGDLTAEAITSSLSAYNGTSDDINKVLILEKIFQERNKKKS